MFCIIFDVTRTNTIKYRWGDFRYKVLDVLWPCRIQFCFFRVDHLYILQWITNTSPNASIYWRILQLMYQCPSPQFLSKISYGYLFSWNTAMGTSQSIDTKKRHIHWFNNVYVNSTIKGYGFYWKTTFVCRSPLLFGLKTVQNTWVVTLTSSPAMCHKCYE